jgi:hypothetical protein
MITVDLARVTAVLVSGSWHEFPAGTLRIDKAIARQAPAAGAAAAATTQTHLDALYGTFRSEGIDYFVPLSAIQAFRHAAPQGA